MPTNHRVYDALNGINIKELRGNGDTILRKDSECQIRANVTRHRVWQLPLHLTSFSLLLFFLCEGKLMFFYNFEKLLLLFAVGSIRFVFGKVEHVL